jgi:AAA family ATP:ADP antiporter
MEMTQKLSRLEKILCIFTEIRSGEGRTALYMFANVFLILCAYYLVKPLREGWIAVSDIQGLSKMEVKAYSSFGQSIFLLLITALYARFSERLPRKKLIIRSTIFCISNLIIFWFLQPNFFIEYLPGTGIAFYLWVGMFGVFVVAQFWAFAADLYTDQQGRRLMPMIAVGATAGAVAGAWFDTFVVDSQMLGTESLLLLATIPLAASAILTGLADAHGPIGQGCEPKEVCVPRVADGVKRGAIRLVLTSRFLLPVAIITLLFSWVNTNGENLLFRVLQEFVGQEAELKGITDGRLLMEYTRDMTTAFYGDFFFWTNIITLLLQAFVVSRLLKYGGFATLLLFLPVVAMLSYATMAFIPVLLIVKWMKIAENSTDYSINNTARNVLWLPTTSEMKFKAKPVIDTLFVRFGDGLAALTVLVGVQLLSLSTNMFFAFNVLLVMIWLAGAIFVIREHKRLSSHEGAQAGR